MNSGDLKSNKQIVSENKPGEGKGFLRRHERLVSFVAFVAGFIFDGVTLTHVNLAEACIILGIYLVVIASSIILYNAVGSHSKPGSVLRIFVSWIPYLIQFMFGTLFNAAFIFYTQSAELGTSWPFIIIIAVAVLGNEIFHKRHQILTFQIVMFFVAEYLYLVLVLPIVTGLLNQFIFVLSGVISLLILVILAFFLSSLARPRFLEKRLMRFVAITTIFAAFNYLYFANIIPPIPLSLKSVGVYHSVVKIKGQYEVQYEPSIGSIAFWRNENDIYHAINGEPVYVFSAVFAPTALSVPIYHDWQYFDETENKWVLVSRVAFPITGGRDAGYRGYSEKFNISPGKWRVYIETEQGQKLGSVYFSVESVSTPVPVKTEIK